MMSGATEDCGGPAGPAQAGGGQDGRLHHGVLVLGTGLCLRRPGPTPGPSASSSLDQIYWPTILPGHVSYTQFTLILLPTYNKMSDTEKNAFNTKTLGIPFLDGWTA